MAFNQYISNSTTHKLQSVAQGSCADSLSGEQGCVLHSALVLGLRAQEGMKEISSYKVKIDI